MILLQPPMTGPTKPPLSGPGLVPGLRQVRRLLRSAPQPLELQLVGRTLLHSVLVGAVAGLVGSAFFYALEVTQQLLLERLAGYQVLRAAGEAPCADAFHYIQGLRLRHGNQVRVDALGAIDRRVLKEAFRQAALLQERIRLDHGL